MADKSERKKNRFLLLWRAIVKRNLAAKFKVMFVRKSDNAIMYLHRTNHKTMVLFFVEDNGEFITFALDSEDNIEKLAEKYSVIKTHEQSMEDGDFEF